MNNRFKNVLLVICLVGASVLLILLFGLINDSNNRTEEHVSNVGESTSSDDLYAEDVDKQILYNGDAYVLNEQLETYLMIGIDQMLEGGTDRVDSHQADFLALIIVNSEEESFRLLHLNRDTMTMIPIIDEVGRKIGENYAQLAISHSYGSHDKARCRNSVDAVENLLYGIEIDHFISITMDAVAILNDSVGGVTLPLLEDFTELDPTYTKDAVVTLTGDQALEYVRARMYKGDSTNLSRMRRQEQYIGALFDKISTVDDKQHSNTTMKALLEVSEYLVSDCTVSQLDKLSQELKNYTYEGIQAVEGEAKVGDKYMEYYVDETALQKLIIQLFYQLYE